MSLPRPRFSLIYRGVDISSDLAPDLISCSYVDEVTGKADAIEVEVQDAAGRWRGSWCPVKGDRVSLSIGYDGGIMLPCGDFEIDEPEASGGRGGDRLAFRGLAAPVSGDLRTRRTRAFEAQSLAEIVAKVASGHGLSVTGPVPDMRFERITQRRERDLEFLQRLADDYGAYFSVRGRTAVFMDRDHLHGRAGGPSVEPTTPGLLEWTVRKAARGTAKAARATYFDGRTKEMVDVVEPDDAISDGDTIRIDDRTETEGHARRRAKSTLAKTNQSKQTASLAFVGRPDLCAGVVIRLGGGFGSFAGRYLVERTRHVIRRSGYTTDVEAYLV